MKAYVGITDYEWYQLLASRPQLEEVNFWQPGGSRVFCADLHTLFDRGYVTVTPELHLEVSRRIREDFENGRHDDALHGHKARRVPAQSDERPAHSFLRWNNEQAFLGWDPGW